MPPVELHFRIPFWRSCEVKILIVTDGGGGYDETSGFHLGQMLKVLANDPWSYITFTVTRAHRGGSAAGGDIASFQFDTHDLSQYDQVWLFGVSTFQSPLTPIELRKLTQFMDAGGGVFATGDHQDLGRPLCGEVPRVRSMRRWWWPNPGPNGEPVAPGQTDGTRHDTVMLLPLGDQSDKIPQPIRPRYYRRETGNGIFRFVYKYPHPVLCGPTGAIDWLPDHMHEGLCEVPSDLTRSWTFDGYTSAEYPVVGGARAEPEVIAWATDRNSGGAEFGVLAAYDGHRANVGRVLVDATWHHWFNINLVGFVAATNPMNPAYDPAVVPQWEEIKAYFRNVALWLARPTTQDCLRNSGLLLATRYWDIIMTYRPRDRFQPIPYFWQLGEFAFDAMGKFASRCQSVKWVNDIIVWPELQFEPWRVPPFPKKFPPPPPPPPWLDVAQLDRVALGGAIHELMDALERDGRKAEKLVDRDDQIDALARRGAARALGEYFEQYEAAGKEAATFRKAVKTR